MAKAKNKRVLGRCLACGGMVPIEEIVSFDGEEYCRVCAEYEYDLREIDRPGSGEDAEEDGKA